MSITISTVRGRQRSRWRNGLEFTGEARVFPDDRFDKYAIARFMDDPILEVVIKLGEAVPKGDEPKPKGGKHAPPPVKKSEPTEPAAPKIPDANWKTKRINKWLTDHKEEYPELAEMIGKTHRDGFSNAVKVSNIKVALAAETTTGKKDVKTTGDAKVEPSTGDGKASETTAADASEDDSGTGTTANESKQINPSETTPSESPDKGKE